MTKDQATTKAQELRGEVVGMITINDGRHIQEAGNRPPEFYRVKVCTGAAGGHLFFSYFGN